MLVLIDFNNEHCLQLESWLQENNIEYRCFKFEYLEDILKIPVSEIQKATVCIPFCWKKIDSDTELCKWFEELIKNNTVFCAVDNDYEMPWQMKGAVPITAITKINTPRGPIEGTSASCVVYGSYINKYLTINE